MLNSVVLDVAAGLIFAFLSISLATSTIVEAIASASKWRSRTLLKGVKDLMNDPNFSGLARTLYGHALVNPRGPGSGAPDKNMPAYIDPQHFAAALLDVSGLSKAMTSGAPTAAVIATVNANIPRATNAQINTLLNGVVQRGLADLDEVRNEIADWFDVGMDRVSGAYKRWSQLVSFAIALVLCVALNVDTVCIARALWVNPGIAAHVKATQDSQAAVRELLGSFPVGWPNGFFANPKPDTKPVTQPVPGAVNGNYWQAFVGWLITAFAALFGAPFWFDALQKIIRLKGSGPSPDEKAGNKAAAA